MFFIISAINVGAGFNGVVYHYKINSIIMTDTSLLKLSEELLYHVKTEKSTQEIELVLATKDMIVLKDGLNNDEAKKAFWINIYNAWFQILKTREKKKSSAIFTQRLILIAGKKFSLDDIEHGILRKYRWKYSKGYFSNIFANKIIRELAVSRIDYRIHFALNCGAKSCPPIAFYSYEKINHQLDIAAKSFLISETEIDDIKKEVKVNRIMDWFIGDFDGKKGIKKIIATILQKDVTNYRIKFKPYNWDESLHNFKAE